MIAPFAILIGLVNYNHLESYMASKLYHIEQENTSFDDTKTFTPTMCGNIGECIIDSLPSCLTCCKKSRQQIRIQKAREVLEEEMDIMELVKAIRFQRMAFHHLLSPRKIKQLEKDS